MGPGREATRSGAATTRVDEARGDLASNDEQEQQRGGDAEMRGEPPAMLELDLRVVQRAPGEKPPAAVTSAATIASADVEGAKFGLRVMTELRNRDVEDILIDVVDDLKGVPHSSTAIQASSSRLPGFGAGRYRPSPSRDGARA